MLAALNAFYPGAEWKDTDGKPIQAHGGSVIVADGKYYFYGENKEKTDGVNGLWHWGIRIYSSTDLYNWKDEGLFITPDEKAPENAMRNPKSYSDRLHRRQDHRTFRRGQGRREARRLLSAGRVLFNSRRMSSTSSFSPLCPSAFEDHSFSASGTAFREPDLQATAIPFSRRLCYYSRCCSFFRFVIALGQLYPNRRRNGQRFVYFFCRGVGSCDAGRG